MLGMNIGVEVTTNKGRIDCVIQTEKTTYVIEFKLNGTKEQALQQKQKKNLHQLMKN